MNIKLPSGKNIAQKDLKNYKNEIKKIIQYKVMFKNKINNKSIVANKITIE